MSELSRVLDAFAVATRCEVAVWVQGQGTGPPRAEARTSRAPDLPALRAQWETIVREVAARATLTVPHESMHSPHLRGGRSGMHSEHLGHLLAELQIVARSHPGAKW